LGGERIVDSAILTHDNAADAMTKTLSQQIFYRHFDTCMGIGIPDYCTGSNQNVQDLHTLHQPLQSKSILVTVKRMVQSMGGIGRTYR
jgi:hypothetical protein